MYLSKYMKIKYLLFFVAIFTNALGVEVQIYTAQEMYIHFFSPAPITDIEAVSNAATAILNFDKKDVEIDLKVSLFKFKKAFMQTHFNEKYIESNKYPNAHFKPKLKNNIDLEKDGTYNLILGDRFSIYGVERIKTIICSVLVKDKKITFETAFKLKSADYKIKAPDIIYRKVRQEINVDAKGILNIIKN